MKKLLTLIVLLLAASGHIQAQENKQVAQDSTMLITYVFRHQQDKSLDTIASILDKNRFWQSFPPKGIEVTHWQVLVGMGHVVTLRLKPSRLRELNLVVEKAAWGAFHTEAYATYDYLHTWKEQTGKD